MQTLQLTAFGDASDVVELLSLPDPEPGAGEVLVQMEAATINASDFLLVNGTYGVRPSLPYRVGGEGVGRVTALGVDVDPGLEGRRVLLLPTYDHGTWATHVVVAEDAIVPVPDDADPLQVAMIGINPMTALLLLRDYGAQEGGPDRVVAQNA
ncbi:MAG: alcohol dehydrogenase catalytic domain-containing protein [Solirubrobacteraceae bacterium]